MKYAVKAVYEQHSPKAISINAWKEGDKIEGKPTAGTCIFEPYGDWSRASEDVPLSLYNTNINISGVYDKEVSVIAVGSKVKIFQEKGKQVGLSNKSDSCMTDELIANIPDGTTATILEVEKFPMVDTVWVHYKISVKYVGSMISGWIHDHNAQVVEE